jgi:hypothetical protein
MTIGGLARCYAALMEINLKYLEYFRMQGASISGTVPGSR